VEISLYGATPETHDAITGVPGSHARAWAGIRRLQAAGVRVALKTVLMKPNLAEREELERQAAAVGAAFRHDAAIFPCLDGARPLGAARRARRSRGADLATAERRATWREKNRKNRRSAGRRTGCMPVPRAGPRSMPIPSAGFRRACWRGMPAAKRRPRVPGRLERRNRRHPGPEARADRHQFRGRSARSLRALPAFNRLETGDDELESDYMKRTTALRFGAAMEMDHESDR
jgi:hypothetical protein